MIIHIFTNNLRLEDNISLSTAVDLAKKNNDQLFCCFIVNEAQLLTNKDFRSEKASKFLIQSLFELSKLIPITIIHSLEEIIDFLENKKQIFITTSYDYSPFARNKFSDLEKFCEKNKITLIGNHELLLHNAIITKKEIFTSFKTKTDELTDQERDTYAVFTPYFNKQLQYKIPKLVKFDEKFQNYFVSKENNKIFEELSPEKRKENKQNNREVALNLLKNVNKDYDHEKGSGLSSYIRFGVVSPRECWHLSKNDQFKRQLVWRDFYFTILYTKPDKFFVDWKPPVLGLTDQEKLKNWKNGQTKLEIINRAMKELNESGHMNNRLRMLTAYYLTAPEYLNINWWYGAKYFSETLEDYCWAQNTGNWLWVAHPQSTWARPSFQKFKIENYKNF